MVCITCLDTIVYPRNSLDIISTTMGNNARCRRLAPYYCQDIVRRIRLYYVCSQLNSTTATSTHKLANTFTSSYVQLTGLGWCLVVLTACDFPRLPVMWTLCMEASYSAHGPGYEATLSCYS